MVVCTYDPKSRRYRGSDGRIYFKRQLTQNPITGALMAMKPIEDIPAPAPTTPGTDYDYYMLTGKTPEPEVNMVGRAVARVKAFLHRS